MRSESLLRNALVALIFAVFCSVEQAEAQAQSGLRNSPTNPVRNAWDSATGARTLSMESPYSSWFKQDRAEGIVAFGIFAATLAGIEFSRRATPQDKAKHFTAGYLVGLAANGAYRLTWGRDKSWKSRALGAGVGLVAAALVGGAKEYYDGETESGTVEREDFDYTVYGGAGGALTIPVIEFLLD